MAYRKDPPRVEGLGHRVVVSDQLLEGAQQRVLLLLRVRAKVDEGPIKQVLLAVGVGAGVRVRVRAWVWVWILVWVWVWVTVRIRVRVRVRV